MSSDVRTDQPTPPPQPARRSQTLTVIMLALGVLLLLPGACALYFAGGFLLTEGADILHDIRRGDPIMTMVLVLWAVCILISLFGIWLIRRARPRRAST
jgi:hypothetical protein